MIPFREPSGFCPRILALSSNPQRFGDISSRANNHHGYFISQAQSFKPDHLVAFIESQALRCKKIGQALNNDGIEIITRSTLASVKGSKKKFSCELAGKKKRRILEVERVLAGFRKPNTADLGLEQAGIQLYEGGFIPHFQRPSSMPPGMLKKNGPCTCPKSDGCWSGGVLDYWSTGFGGMRSIT